MAANVPLNMAIQLKGVDATAGAFSSVAARAGQVVRKVGGAVKGVAGAVAAIGAAVTAATKIALNEMNTLHDEAQQAGVSSSWLQKFSGAMAQAGVMMQRSDIVKSVQKLNASLVNTEKQKAFEKLGIDVSHLQGLAPEEAFHGFLEVISKIPDEQTRLLALQRGLEEQGLKLAPLMRLGPEEMKRSLSDVMEMIPATKDETVNLATDVNNALAFVSSQIKNDFWSALGTVLSTGTETFGSLDVAVAVMYERFRLFCTNTVTIFSLAWKAIFTDWETFANNVRAGMVLLGAEVLNFRDKIAAGFAKMIGETFYGWGDEASASVDEAYWAAKDARNSLAASATGDSVFAQARMAMEQNAAEFEARVEQIKKGFAAKATLTALKPATEPLKESVSDAVASGVREGLAEGVQAGSYAVIKNAFKARNLSFLGGDPEKLPDQIVKDAIKNAKPQQRTISTTPGSTDKRFDSLPEMLDVLKKLLNATETVNDNLVAIGSF